MFEERFPGRKGFVYHEILSDLVHIDVNILPPSSEDGFTVAYTTGMSDKPMTLPDELADHEELKYAEVFLFLPRDWDLGKEFQSLGSDVPPERFWPIHMLKFLTRFPHEYNTWLGPGHTIPNGPNYSPLGPGVGFGGVALAVNGALDKVEVKDGRRVNLLFAIPAYQEEIEYKLKYGMNALLERFSQQNMPIVLDIHRPNLCADFTEILDGPEN